MNSNLSLAGIFSYFRAMKTLSEKIKRYREAKNYSQEYVAAQLGIAQNSYSKIENGHTSVSADRLIELAKVLDVPVENLLSEEAQSFSFNNSHIERFYNYIQHLQEDNKEIANTTIKTLEEQIKHLQEENKRLLDTIETLTGKIKP